MQILNRYGKKDATTVDVENIRNIFVTTGALAYAKEKVVEYTEAAKRAITTSAIGQNAKKILFDLSDSLIVRKA